MTHFSKRHRGPGEEEFGKEMLDRIKSKFNDCDPESTGNIGMESFGVLVGELDLVREDDSEAMDQAFHGMEEIDDRDQMTYNEFLLIARRLNFRKKESEEKKKMADITEE